MIYKTDKKIKIDRFLRLVGIGRNLGAQTAIGRLADQKFNRAAADLAVLYVLLS